MTFPPPSAILFFVKSIHTRIRILRKQQQRTLKEIAERCGFTISLLSKIESGKTSPPVATLTKIAAALGVSLGDLINDGHEENTVITTARKLSKSSLTKTDKGYGFHLLAVDRSTKSMQPILFVAERGKVVPSPMTHRGEEFVYVLEGRMSYRVGDTTYTLGPGDSLYFNAEEEHDLEPLTASTKYLAVFSERAAQHSSPSSKTP